MPIWAGCWRVVELVGARIASREVRSKWGIVAYREVMDMYVVCENRRGKVSQAADAISEAAASHGVATLVRSIDEVVLDDLLAADVVVVGCKVQSDTPFGGEPARRMADWVDDLVPLDGLPVGVFCTYAFFPHTFADVVARTSAVLATLSAAFELKGGKVVATQGLHQGELVGAAESFVSKVLGGTQS